MISRAINLIRATQRIAPALFVIITVIALLLSSRTARPVHASGISFAPAPGSPLAVVGVNSVAVADFNGDGKLDLAVVGNKVSVLLGKGDGTFSTPTTYDINLGTAFFSGRPQVAWSLTVGDFNGDGKPDIATASQSSSTVSVLLGKGDGNFNAHTDYPGHGFPVRGPLTDSLAEMAESPHFITVGDFNGDGKLDILTANWAGFADGSTVSVLLGKGDGTFGPYTDFSVGDRPASVVVADFNGDGKLDLATANIGRTVSVLLGDGKGSFGPATTLTVSQSPIMSIATGDFNGDGKLDLVMTASEPHGIYLLAGDGKGGFGTPSSFQAGSLAQAIAVGDFDGDHKPDIAVGEIGGNMGILLG